MEHFFFFVWFFNNECQKEEAFKNVFFGYRKKNVFFKIFDFLENAHFRHLSLFFLFPAIQTHSLMQTFLCEKCCKGTKKFEETSIVLVKLI